MSVSLFPADRLRYCAIGDSLTVGIGSSFFVKGFVTKYLWLLRNSLERPIVPCIFARNGATSGEILNALQHPIVRDGIIRSDIITITAGGNDLIDAAEAFLQTKNEQEFYRALDTCKINLASIIDEILRMKKNGHRFIIRMINLYDPFENIPGTDKWVEAFNQGIERLGSPPIIKVANIHDRFKERTNELLANDHIHPNPKGYEIIADALLELGTESLGLEVSST